MGFQFEWKASTAKQRRQSDGFEGDRDGMAGDSLIDQMNMSSDCDCHCSPVTKETQFWTHSLT